MGGIALLEWEEPVGRRRLFRVLRRIRNLFQEAGAEIMMKWLCCLTIGLLALLAVDRPHFAGASEAGEIVFDIRSYQVDGNTLLSKETIEERLTDFTGSMKTAEDVENARGALETLYHDLGYPTVLVNIPEQGVESGVIRLEAIEGKIRRVTINGNRYYTMEKIRSELPSFKPGEVPYLPKLQEEINKINSNADIKVAPRMTPAEETGSIDVDLEVNDRLPLHASLELNNRASPDTTDLRLSAMIRYDNLWQRDHSVSVQYQSSPLDLDEVQVVAASYVLPVPSRPSDRLAIYGVWSDSATAFGEGFKTVGEGFILGARYVLPLPAYEKYQHNITFGIDYKDFEDVLGFEEDVPDSGTAVQYLPISIAYGAFLPDEKGLTQFSAGINAAFRGLVTDQEEFDNKRFKARGNYILATAGVERYHKLPWESTLFVKVDGQVADQPLISNEQYSAGGMDSVRGYKESEGLGDNAVHATVELSAPDLVKKLGFENKSRVVPYAFHGVAFLHVKEALPDQDKDTTLHSAGVGVRGSIAGFLEYDAGIGIPLTSTEHTDKHELGGFFMVKYNF